MKKVYLLPLLFLMTLYADPAPQEDKEVISVEEVVKSDEELAETGSHSSPNPKSSRAPSKPAEKSKSKSTQEPKRQRSSGR